MNEVTGTEQGTQSADRKAGKGGRRRKLSTKIFACYIIVALLLILAISIALGMWYWSERMEQHNELAYSYADTAVAYIDGDRVLEYLETGERDEYYWKIQNFITATQQNTSLVYYYVYVPQEDSVAYIWASETPDSLGMTDPYDEGGKEVIAALFKGELPREIVFSYSESYGYLASANAAIYNSDGEPVAVVGADISTPGVVRGLLSFIAIIVLCVMVIVLISMTLFYGFIRRNIIMPIAQVSTGAKNMVNNLETGTAVQMDIHTGDEIEELAHSFSRMNVEVQEYIRKLSAMTAEKERIGAELSVATQIQADMLPRIYPAFPQRREFDIYASMTPAKEVGGDFYDFFMVDDDHLMLVIADVSGKGVPAALFMVIAKTLLKNSAEQNLSPKAIFEKVNNQLCENNDEGMFVTVWMGLLEISTGRMICANAGHEDPIVIRNGKAEVIRQRHGLLMAQMENAPYREQEITLQPGDTIFVYTDGVSEATSAANKLYGKERLLATLDKAAGKSPEELLAIVKEDVDAFAGDAPQFDDITMLALKMNAQNDPALTELRTEPTLDNIYQVTDFVEERLSELGVPMKVLIRINVAVDELFSNIVRYSGADECVVACGVQDNRAIVQFADNGAPYDPTSRPEMDTTLSLEERGEGGMGIHMVRKTMDSVRYEYRDSRNVLTLEKAW